MSQVVSIILMIIGVILVAPSLLIYILLNRMENKMEPEEVTLKLFKKRIPNSAARLDLMHVILLAVMIIGLTLLLIGVICGVSANA